jgi:hypothetical protein
VWPEAAGHVQIGGYYGRNNGVAFVLRVSLSLPEEQVHWLDGYGPANGFPTRSAVVEWAIRLLKGAELTSSYEAAWTEWRAADQAADWDAMPDGPAA